MLTIHQRPFPPDDRSEPGHWESDLIIGKEQASAIGTLVERTTRTIRLLHLPRRDSDHLHAALKDRMRDLPPTLLCSITWDQGTEMARHTTISATLGAPFYFCDSHSPWQRSSNENPNGLLHQYCPKGTDLSIHTPSSCGPSRTRSTTCPATSSETAHQPAYSLHCQPHRRTRVATLTRTRPAVDSDDGSDQPSGD